MTVSLDSCMERWAQDELDKNAETRLTALEISS